MSMSDDEMINAGIKSPDEIFRDKSYSLVQVADKALMERFAAFDEALVLLKKYEYAGRAGDDDYGDGEPVCPECWHDDDEGHTPDCRLAAFLKKWA